MSWRYAAAVVWICDGCGIYAPGFEGVLPDGWRQVTSMVKDAPTGRAFPEDGHFCARCVPQEPK